MDFNDYALNFKENTNERNFNSLYFKIKPYLEDWISRFVKGDQVSEILNDTMLVIWKKIGTFDPSKSSFKTWVWTISKRICFNYLRKEKNKKTNSLDLMIEDYGFDIPYQNDSKFNKDKLLQIVLDEINSLDYKYKKFFIDVYKHNLDHKSISRKRNIPLHTVKNRLYYGRNKIKKKLKDNNEVDKIFMERTNKVEDFISIH